MTLYQVLLLSVLQGLTEFLPISSSGHLALLGQIQGLVDQGLAFDAAIHLGTLAAIMWYARSELQEMFWSLAGNGSVAGRQLAVFLLLGSIPVLLVGWLLVDWIEAATRSMAVIASTTLVFGVLLGLADSFGRRHMRITQLKLPAVLWIGLAQVLALVPGTSRSGITMTAGLALGLTREQTAKFSFLLAIPVLAAAGGYNLLRMINDPQALPQALPMLLLAMLVSALVAFATIRLFMRVTERIGMWPFAIYRMVLAVVLLSLLV